MKMKMMVPAAMLVGSILMLPSAHADTATATRIDSLTATVTGTAIQVAGTVTFVDVPVEVGTDAASDSRAPGSDLTSARISRPDPSKKNLIMRVGVGNMPPSLDGTPLALYFNWSILVSDANGANSKEFLLQANRAPGSGLPATDPVFKVMTCVPGTGASTCTVSSTVTGTFDSTGLSVTVPTAAIGANTGSIISVGPNNLVSTVGAGAPAVGDAWFTNLGGDSMSHDDYIVAGPSVKLGIAPAGTNPAAVALTKTATVASNGSAFASTLPKPAAGSYVLVAEACYTGADCVLSSTDITVA